MRKIICSVFLLTGLFILNSCDNEQSLSPKPRGYFRAAFPPHEYKLFEPADCPFSFEVPKHSFVVPDTNSVSEPCWYYIILPELNGQLYLTYKTVKSSDDIRTFMEDTRTLVYKHTSRASSIDEKIVAFTKGVYGVFYDIGGDAASPSQFFVTDSSQHFLRGALYFNAVPNADSIAPSVAYVKEDVLHLLKSLRWK